MFVREGKSVYLCLYNFSLLLHYQWLTTVNGIEAKIPGRNRINGQLKILDLPLEAGKKTIPGTVNEENLTTGYVASFQPYLFYHFNQ